VFNAYMFGLAKVSFAFLFTHLHGYQSLNLLCLMSQTHSITAEAGIVGLGL